MLRVLRMYPIILHEEKKIYIYILSINVSYLMYTLFNDNAKFNPQRWSWTRRSSA